MSVEEFTASCADPSDLFEAAIIIVPLKDFKARNGWGAFAIINPGAIHCTEVGDPQACFLYLSNQCPSADPMAVIKIREMLDSLSGCTAKKGPYSNEDLFPLYTPKCKSNWIARGSCLPHITDEPSTSFSL